MTLDQAHCLHVGLNTRLLQDEVIATIILHPLVLLLIESQFVLSAEVLDNFLSLVQS